MKKFTATFASIAVVSMLAAPAFAQDPQPQRPQPAPEIQPQVQQPAPEELDAPKTLRAKGELVKVDPDAMAVTIKSADGTEQKFRYTDRTQVTNVQNGVEGLATKTGALVTVHYTEGAGDVRIATKIEPQEKR